MRNYPGDGYDPKDKPRANSSGWQIASCLGISTLLLLTFILFVLVLVSNSTIDKTLSRLKSVDESLRRHANEEGGGGGSSAVAYAIAMGNEMVVANFCREAGPVKDFNCGGNSQCFVPLKTFESLPAYLTIDGANRALINVNTKSYYKIRLIVRGRTMCPFHVVPIALVNIDSLGNAEVLAAGTIGAHSFMNVTVSFLLSAGTKLAVRIADPVGNAKVHLSLEAIVTSSGAYEHLVISTNHDLTQGLAWIPARPVTAPPAPSLQFPPQYPNSAAVYPWLSPVIPANPITSGPLPPGVPNNWGHNKFQSVPFSIGDFMGLDMESMDPADPLLSLFLTNRENRGFKEHRKAVYMSALRACLVQHAYREKTRSFLNRVYSDVTTYNRPLMSAFKTALVDYLIDVHVGVSRHPPEVITYFSEFIEFIGVGSPLAPGRDERVLLGRELTPLVKAYFVERNSVVIANKDVSSIVYHWALAGLAPEGLVMETIHNSIAFEQFLNILYKLIIDKISGTPQPVAGTIQYNFFAKHKAVLGDKVARLNVVREVMRLTSPNAVSFSKVEGVAGVNSRFLHQSVMISAMANLTGIAGAYFGYNANLYSSIINYNTSIDSTACSAADASAMAAATPDALFIRSVVPGDNQTFWDAKNPQLIATFPLPIYAPFGLGYRRCPGEILVYDIVDMLLETFANIEWVFGTSGSPAQVCVAPFTCVSNNIYAQDQSEHA